MSVFICVFTQTGPCVSQCSAALLSAGFFMQKTFIPIGLSQNTAHWCPLPDHMSQCTNEILHERMDHTCTHSWIIYDYILWSSSIFKSKDSKLLHVDTVSYINCWLAGLLTWYAIFTLDKTEDKHTLGYGLHFPEPLGTRIPLDCDISGAYKTFL